METRPVAAEGALRPSFVTIAIGIGIGAGFASFDAGRAVGPAFVVGMKAFGYTLAALFALPVLGWLLGAAGDALATWDAMRLAAQTAPDETDTAPLRSPLVDGGLMDEAEHYVQDGLMRLLEHARHANALTFSQIGHAFNGNRAHWVWWTNVLARSRLADKQNGVDTVLPPGKTWTWALRQVRNGVFEMPDLGTDATLPPLPAPLRPDSHVKVKPEMA